MNTLKYTKDHEWLLLEDDDTAVIGITDYAQEQLGEMVFVELPDVGRDISQGEEAAVVESVKAAGDVKAPVSGIVVEVNEALADEPGKVNEDPLGDGWFFKLKISDPKELDKLLDESDYNSLLEAL
jgi:glycine cleavage system H protein